MKLTALTILAVFVLSFTSYNKNPEFSASFDNTHDRVWVGKDFWSVPLEDWKVENGQLHCVGTVPQSRVNLLTWVISPGTGDFEASVTVSGNDNQVMQIWNEKSGELAQIYRIKGNTVQPKLYESGTFSVIIGEDKNKETVTGLKTSKGKNPEKVFVEL